MHTVSDLGRIVPVPSQAAVEELAPVRRETPAEGGRDRQFIALLMALRAHGGLLRESEIARRVERSVLDVAPLSVRWNGERWWPWFQFDMQARAIDPTCEAIAAELAGHYDAWQLLAWFVEPSAWLDHCCPAGRLRSDAAAVRAAARADRFIALG